MTPDQAVSIGLDVGGTKVAVGVVEPDGHISARARAATPPAADLPAVMAELIGEVADDRSIAGVGIGAAGFIAADRRTVLVAPNIDWHDEPLADRLEALINAPVVVENDANAAAWGEFRFGAARGVDQALLVTVGTGVGGGIVQHGRLQRGAHGIAAEIGHLRIVRDGRPCPCGQLGCFEQYASGRALVRAARASGYGDDVDGPRITHDALAGNPAAAALLAELGTWLGEGIASLVAILDPGVVVIGGGVAEAGDLLLDPIRSAFQAHLTAGGRRPAPTIVAAALGNDAGLIGAADLAVEG